MLSRHADVAAVAVIAVPDAGYLEVGCAVVKPLRPAQDHGELENSLRELAAAHLARYKCPKHYAFVNDFPLNPSGKILKRILRDQYAGLGCLPGQQAT